MADDVTQPRRKTGRGIRIALGVSLAVNLLILGAVGGAMLSGGPGGRMHGRGDIGRTLGLGPLGMALDRPDRAALFERAERDRETLRAGREALLAATLAFAEAVSREPFDRDAAEAALTRQRNEVRGLQEWGHEALLDRLEVMPQEEREAFAGRLLGALRRHGDHAGGR